MSQPTFFTFARVVVHLGHGRVSRTGVARGDGHDIRDRGLEGIRFDAVSQFDGSFRCFCEDVSIAELEPAD